MSLMEPLTAPAKATILICYHPPRRRRTVDNYGVCTYCLTMRETTANWSLATVRYHTNTALYDDTKQLISSNWNAATGERTPPAEPPAALELPHMTPK